MTNRQPITTNTLFYGDNYDILRERIADESIDLIYLDPPFNSNRNYNVLFKQGREDSTAQLHAFEDTWEWTLPTIRLFDELRENPNPRIAIVINSLAEIIGKNPMMAYIVMMTARLIELHRVLKPTGSIYLHCDATASHYLKIVMDTVFGVKNFRNDIIWHYSGWNKKLHDHFERRADNILFYAKGSTQIFNGYARPWASVEEYLKVRKQKLRKDENGRDYVLSDGGNGTRVKRYIEDAMKSGAAIDNVWNIDKINNSSKEFLGYPTQKPEVLLERIIKASSNEGSWILDPFCGCGTTVSVAQRLNRNWIGIDISMQAINVIVERLQNHYPGIQINTDGIPKDYESARNLAEKDKFKFEGWAISLVGANPPSGAAKKGADRGVDGLILFYEKADFNKQSKLRKILVQVKGGGTGRGDVAKLKGDMIRDDAPLGILITLRDPTPEMKREAALAGEYKYSDTTIFPKIQILSIRDWFNGKGVQLPSNKVNPFKKAEVKSDQEELF